MESNTDRHALSAREFYFDVKNSLLRPQSEHPVPELSATPQQGNRVCTYHTLDQFQIAFVSNSYFMVWTLLREIGESIGTHDAQTHFRDVV